MTESCVMGYGDFNKLNITQSIISVNSGCLCLFLLCRPNKILQNLYGFSVLTHLWLKAIYFYILGVGLFFLVKRC